MTNQPLINAPRYRNDGATLMAQPLSYHAIAPSAINNGIAASFGRFIRNIAILIGALIGLLVGTVIISMVLVTLFGSHDAVTDAVTDWSRPTEYTNDAAIEARKDANTGHQLALEAILQGDAEYGKRMLRFAGKQKRLADRLEVSGPIKYATHADLVAKLRADAQKRTAAIARVADTPVPAPVRKPRTAADFIQAARDARK